MADEEWPDPTGRTVERRRLVVRLACASATLAVLVYLSRGFLVDAQAALWPPTEPFGQWATFTLLLAFGYVVVPLLVGSFVADVLLERIETDGDE